MPVIHSNTDYNKMIGIDVDETRLLIDCVFGDLASHRKHKAIISTSPIARSSICPMLDQERPSLSPRSSFSYLCAPLCTKVLERVAQIPLVVAGTYNTYDSESHGTNENYDARSHDRNSASANNSSDGGFRACI